MESKKGNANEQQSRFTDPSVNLWTTYLSMSEKENKVMAQNWKGDMDAILIFAGLFSASVTAFIVESYKVLNPDPNDTSVLLLAQISQQLGVIINNGSQLANPPLGTLQSDKFTPPASALACNYLWFLSLSFSLICALSATLVEQWTRRYLQATTSRPAPQDRARMSAFLYDGIKAYRMAAIVEIIPMLLHISLFFFFAGLVAFLAPLNTGLEYLILAILVTGCSLYILVSILPVLDLSCPFWTPLCTKFWSIFRTGKVIERKDTDGNPIPVPQQMFEARDLDAMQISGARDERDLRAICWTIRSQREDHEFEPFVEIIPSVVSGFDYSSKWLIKMLLDHPDPAIRLGSRIPRLLATCTTGTLDSAQAQRRAVTCIRSIWSLSILEFPRPPILSEDTWAFVKFKEDTFNLLDITRRSIPSLSGYVYSTSVAIARAILDMYADRLTLLEDKMLDFLEKRQQTLLREGYPDPGQTLCDHRSSEIVRHISVIELRHQELKNFLSQKMPLTTPPPYLTLNSVVAALKRLLRLAMEGRVETRIIRSQSSSIRHFQALMSQAGLQLTLDYINNILESTNLPHEAFHTLRRTFLRINFEISSQELPPHGPRYLSSRVVSFPRDAQERLVTYLEEAVELVYPDGTRLPESIINIIIKLTQALSDPTLTVKAIYILQDYAPSSSTDSAATAIEELKQKLPLNAYSGHDPSNIFTSHVYSQAKPDRPPRKPVST